MNYGDRATADSLASDMLKPCYRMHSAHTAKCWRSYGLHRRHTFAFPYNVPVNYPVLRRRWKAEWWSFDCRLFFRLLVLAFVVWLSALLLLLFVVAFESIVVVVFGVFAGAKFITRPRAKFIMCDAHQRILNAIAHLVHATHMHIHRAPCSLRHARAPFIP